MHMETWETELLNKVKAGKKVETYERKAYNRLMNGMLIEVMENEFKKHAKSWGLNPEFRIHRYQANWDAYVWNGSVVIYWNTSHNPKLNLGKFRTWLNSHGLDYIESLIEEGEEDMGRGWLRIHAVAF